VPSYIRISRYGETNLRDDLVIMIYTLGCSFTKWYWPTWADWLSVYQHQPVTNLAYVGYTNDMIYYQLLAMRDKLTANDQVLIMWTGSNRICQWYDHHWIDQHNIKGFFPSQEGKLWFGDQEPWHGLYKTHPDHQPSLTHMLAHSIDIWHKTQLLLDSIGVPYKMMFWQNPWADVRETWHPSYLQTWHTKQRIGPKEIDLAKKTMSIQPIQNQLSNIDWKKFVCAPEDLLDPVCWKGLWEFVLEHKELVLASHVTDPHPNSLAHHDWLTNRVLGVDPVLRSAAIEISKHSSEMEIPVFRATDCLDGQNAVLNRFVLPDIHGRNRHLTNNP
jgi:hypothetical protein